jgi:APA family basic amino acid/polyamine antiporter
LAGIFQLVSGTYNGFAAPVLFAEEDKKPSQNIPKSLYGGALIVIIVYLLINLAVLYVLPVAVLKDSKLALADVASVVLGEWGASLITLISLLSLLSILNAYLMIAPRILYGLSRAGFFSAKGLMVNQKGTPSFVLLFTCLVGLVLIYLGSFEQLYNFSALIEILVTLSLFASVIRLRITEPDLARPHRAWGYPWVPILMIVVSICFLIGFLYNNYMITTWFLMICLLTVPAFYWIRSQSKPSI